jgi:SAM-dependent methyltransferase
MAINEAVSDGDVAASQPALEFGDYYYAHDCGTAYERNDHWNGFFGAIASRIASDLQPTSVLDAGCAIGMLVEQLRKIGVDAYGIDVSEWAIDQVPDEIRPYCRRASLTEPIDRRYDLITCIEVIEHIPAPDAATAVEQLCRATDRILVSSSPWDYAEPTHVNVRPPEDWAAMFARNGFVRDLDFDASFLTPWASLYVRSTAALPEVIRAFERRLFHSQQEISQLRTRALEIQQNLAEQYEAPGGGAEQIDALRRELSDARRELLINRDEVIGARAELGNALGRIRELEDEVARYQSAVQEISGFKRTPMWTGFGIYLRIRDRLRHLRRRILDTFNL